VTVEPDPKVYTVKSLNSVVTRHSFLGCYTASTKSITLVKKEILFCTTVN